MTSASNDFSPVLGFEPLCSGIDSMSQTLQAAKMPHCFFENIKDNSNDGNLHKCFGLPQEWANIFREGPHWVAQEPYEPFSNQSS